MIRTGVIDTDFRLPQNGTAAFHRWSDSSTFQHRRPGLLGSEACSGFNTPVFLGSYECPGFDVPGFW